MTDEAPDFRSDRGFTYDIHPGDETTRSDVVVVLKIRDVHAAYMYLSTTEALALASSLISAAQEGRSTPPELQGQ